MQFTWQVDAPTILAILASGLTGLLSLWKAIVRIENACHALGQRLDRYIEEAERDARELRDEVKSIREELHSIRDRIARLEANRNQRDTNRT